jgi:hypothetical protein
MEIVRSRSFQGLSNKPLGAYFVATVVFSTIALLEYSSEIELALASGMIALLTLIPSFIESNKRYHSLLPIIDSCNHQSINPSCEVKFDSFFSEFMLKSAREIRKDSEVTISYGNKTNDELFQYFGFVEENNPHDNYVITNIFLKISKILERADIKIDLKTGLKTDFLNLKPNTSEFDSITVNKRSIQSWDTANYRRLITNQASDEVLVLKILHELIRSEFADIEENSLRIDTDKKFHLINKFISSKKQVLLCALNEFSN